jgi:hypothetical protein
MKKTTFIKKAALMLIVFALTALFFGCDLFKPETEEGEKTITVIIDLSAYEEEITVDEGVQQYDENKIKTVEIKTEALRFERVMAELAEMDFFTYWANKSVYGFFVTGIDNVSQDEENGIYFLIYNNDEENSNNSWGEYNYNDAKLGSASSGISDLPVKDGCIYAFVYSAFSE